MLKLFYSSDCVYTSVDSDVCLNDWSHICHYTSHYPSSQVSEHAPGTATRKSHHSYCIFISSHTYVNIWGKWVFLFDLILYVPVYSFSVMSEWVFLVISTKQGLICLAQGHNAVMLVRLEPTAPRSGGNSSTTESLRSLKWVLFNYLPTSVVCWYYLCKQFEPRSGQTKRWTWSVSKLFGTLMVFQKEFFKKVYFEKYQQQTTKIHEKLPRGQRVKLLFTT